MLAYKDGILNFEETPKGFCTCAWAGRPVAASTCMASVSGPEDCVSTPRLSTSGLCKQTMWGAPEVLVLVAV